MKFGDNLPHLSIPQWKSYNLDYNNLKSQIRSITKSKSSTNNDLSSLKQSFIENFDYINLFIETKYGELTRKFICLENQFKFINNNSSGSGSIDTILIQLDELFYQTIELSIELKNLSKFIIIQKIAIKKIFKKFLKYYPHKQQAKEFVLNLKQYYLDHSKIKNLNSLTLKLTNLINIIKYERKSQQVQYQQYRQTQNKTHNQHDANLRRNNSLFSITSTIMTSSDYQNSILPPKPATITTTTNGVTTLNNLPIQQTPTSNESWYDLSLLLKKNFHIHCLIHEDAINDLKINFNLYYQLKPINTDSDNDNWISCTYLTRDYLLDDDPAYILTHKNNDHSIIVAPIGGLRRFSYCILPNNIVQILIYHLNDRSNENYKQELLEFFQKLSSPSLLTKKTIDFIVSNDFKPSLKLFCKRSRYLIEPNDENDENGSVVIDSDYTDGKTTGTGNGNGNGNGTGTTNNKSSGDDSIDNDYLITLDSDIMTTNKSQYVNDLTFFLNEQELNQLDIFPHGHITISSNDINLSNFENSLITEIDLPDNKNGATGGGATGGGSGGGIIKNHHDNLRKLPKKIQTILNNNPSLTLFKQLNFYQYQLSCYYNIIPQGELINNHYNNLLNLNLLKNFEDLQTINDQTNQEHELIERKSKNILNHKMSLCSLSTPLNDPLGRDRQLQLQLQSNSRRNSSIFERTKRTDEEGEEDYDDDGYGYDGYDGYDDVDDQISLSLNELINQDEDILIHHLKHQQQRKLYHQNNNNNNNYHNHNHNYVIPTFIDKLLIWKNKFFASTIGNTTYLKKPFANGNNKVYENPFFLTNEEEDEFDEVPLDPYTKLLSLYHHQQHHQSLGHKGSDSNYYHYNNNSTYDSINEDPLPQLLSSSYQKRNDYQLFYEFNYDQTLSYIYFTLNIISLFLSGIQLGIFMSILQKPDLNSGGGGSDIDYQFLIRDNIGLIVILTLGIITSLIFGLISVNLLIQRFNQPPMFHILIVWGGLLINLICCIWSGVLLIGCI